MNAQDIYIELKDPLGKHPAIVSHHRVWDRKRFLDAQHQTFVMKAKESDKRIVRVATEADYRNFMGYKELAA